MKNYIILVTLLLSHLVTAQQKINITPAFECANTIQYMNVYAQGDTIIDVQRVLSGKLKSEKINRDGDELYFMAKPLSYWSDFYIEQQDEKDRELILESTSIDIDRIQVYVLDSQNVVVQKFPIAGDHEAFSKRVINNRFLTYPLHLKAKQRYRILIYFEQFNAFLHFKLNLYATSSYIVQKQLYDFRAAFQILSFVIMTVLSFIILYILKNRLVLFFFLYCSNGLLYWIATTGFGMQLFWNNSTIIGDQGRNISLIISFFLAGLLAIEICELPRHFHKLYLIIRTVIYILLTYSVIAILYIVFPLPYRVVIFSLGWTICSILVILIYAVIILHYYRFRERHILFLLFSHSIGILATIIYVLMIFGIINDLSLTTLLDLSALSFYILFYILIDNLIKLHNKQQQQQLELKTVQQQARTNIIIGQELERQQISLFLHDNIAVFLASLKMKFSTIFNPADPKHEELFLELDEISDEIRNMSHELSPHALKSGNLTDAIRDTLGRIQYLAPELMIEFELDHFEEAAISLEIKKAIFFISQELLYNIVKHANASKIVLTLSLSESHLYYELLDDGVSYEIEAEHYSGIGLQNITARLVLLNGTIQVHKNKKSKGMTRIVKIPLSEHY